ncbi:hypothetical protein MHYP_G00346810 [Metynnis hypsauchen]
MERWRLGEAQALKALSRILAQICQKAEIKAASDCDPLSSHITALVQLERRLEKSCSVKSLNRPRLKASNTGSLRGTEQPVDQSVSHTVRSVQTVQTRYCNSVDTQTHLIHQQHG